MIVAADVAKWMISEIEKKQILYREAVVCDIQQNFGEDFIYVNQNGNFSISKEVLLEFRKLTRDNVVWVHSGKYWRFRDGTDESTENKTNRIGEERDGCSFGRV